MTFYTFKKVALAHKAAWQRIKFAAGKGYYLVGKRPVPVVAPEPKNQPPFTRPVVAPAPTVMYDDIDPSLIPKDAPAVAGYVGGHWPTYPTLGKLFPNAPKLSIAVTSQEDAECLDVEPGDATNVVAPTWVKRQLARGVVRPVVYTSASNVAALLAMLDSAGIRRKDVRVWTAHYTGKPHLCSKSACGYDVAGGEADATQFTSHALGRSLDESLCSPSFFKPVPAV